MPYKWMHDSDEPPQELHLWPHQSLPPYGKARFLLLTSALMSLPLFGLLGTSLLWALLPFLGVALAALWLALSRSNRDRSILEVLSWREGELCLTRHDPRQTAQSWSCNPYWARPSLYPSGGPVPNYVTLSGNGREVEIGSFLSEEERVALFDDLKRRLSQ